MTEPAKHAGLRAALTRWASEPAQALARLRRVLTPKIETRQLMLKAAYRALLGVALIWANPLDLFHKADEASSNAFQYVVSALGMSLPEYRPGDKDPNIAVVLFTPSAFANINEKLEPDERWAWPLSFTQQADILNTIAGYKPLAIFYDIEFYQERDGEAAFHDALAKTTKAGNSDTGCYDGDMDGRPQGAIPVFLARPPEPEQIRKMLCAAGTVAVNVLWNGRPNIYPFHDAADPACRNAIPREKKCFFINSPATMLFKVWCEQRPAPPTCFPAWGEPGMINPVWRTGYGPAVILKKIGLAPEECDLPSPPPASPISSVAEWHVTTCPAPSVVNAFSIENVAMRNRDAALTHRHYRNPALEKALAGKIVMIGAEFPGMRDRVASPYYGLVPGVFAHVTALDNLMHWGPRYIHAESDHEIADRAGQFLIVAMLLFIIMYVIERLRKYAPSLAHLAHHQAPTRTHGYDAAIVVGGIAALVAGTAAALLLISTGFFFLERIAPLNWIGELAVVWVFAFEETLFALLLVLLVFPLFSERVRAFACHLVEKPEEKSHD